MKKTLAECLILIAVLTTAVVSAGCIGEVTPTDSRADVPDVVSIIEVEKNGVSYSIGDTMEVNLPVPDQSRLYVKDCEDGISVDMKELTVKRDDKEAPYAGFTVTALKNGNYSFTIGIDSPRSKEYGLDDVMYKDSVDIEDTGADPMIPRSVFTLTNLVGHPPYAGEYTDVSIRGNPSAGYKWVVLNSPGLIISEPVYIPDENPEKTDGGDGTYHWYVTSYIPGDYEFTAYSMPPGSDELKGRIFVPVSIANKPN